MKKFLSMLMAVLMLLVGCLPAVAEDAEWKINATTQLVSRKSAAEKLESIVVPAEVDGIAVRGVEYMAFNMYKNFKQLTIADSVVMLDRRVLRDLTKLETVDLPKELLVIREGNFTNVPALTGVVIPASVEVVHSSFNSCKSLKSITFEGKCPVFVTAGDFGMFTDLPADCVIFVPDNQVEAYKAAFAGRDDVVARIQSSGRNAYAIDRTAPESDFVFDAATGTITGYIGDASFLEIPAAIGDVQVKHIAADAFMQCHSLCCVIIPEGVETVGDGAFSGIALLSYVSLPSTLVSLGNEAFSSNQTYMSAIAFNGSAVPTFSADAFAGFKGDWHVILPYGSDQAYVDAFAAYIAPSADKAIVGASLVDPALMPAVGAEDNAIFCGAWHDVAGKDVMGDFTNDYPGVDAILNSDGTGTMVVDGDEIYVGWYVESGFAFFAPVVDGKVDESQTFAYACMDENNRLVMDFGYASAICEQDGVVYDVPARPEMPWPEFNMDDAAYYIGAWESVSYIMGDEIYDADVLGHAALTLYDDGTAIFAEEEEEPYSLRWYADYPSAYVGPTMNELVELTFDGEGNIRMDQGGVVIVLAPVAEATDDGYEMMVAEPVGAEGEAYFGTWTMDMGGMAMNLILNQDGTCAMEMFGEYEYAVWTVEDGVAMIMGDAMYIDANGCLVAGSMGMTFTKVSGAAPAPAPAANADLSAYYGTWSLEFFMGMPAAEMDMVMTLTISEDGTCTMSDGSSVETANWTVEDGMVAVDGEKLAIDASGRISMADGLMIFVKGGAAAPAPAGIPHIEATADDYIGGWICVEMPSMQLLLLDGEANLIDGDELYTTTWEVVDGVAEFDGMKLYLLEDWSGMVDMGGEMIKFERGYVEKPKTPVADPVITPPTYTDGFDAEEYYGVWQLESMMGIDVSLLGMTMELIINEDGTCSIYDGEETEDGLWTMENGVVVIDEMPLLINDEGKLTMGEGEVEMVFVRLEKFGDDEMSDEELLALLALLAQMEGNEGGDTTGEPQTVQYVGEKFVCKTYTTFGQTMDASMLGAEYGVKFNADNTCEFTMAGFTVPSLPYTVTAEGVYAINYYGTMFNCVPTANGFDMDYYGTMTLHFVPAQ